ncbi:MAG TPA: ASCH domain-containing protein [Blastocatellia bacterium]|nr:ASCH domain-containing protein [Blastocatellia bacterium]
MKALTIKQPWASLIIFRGKDIENREWEAPSTLIGRRIAIHSSKKMEPEDIDDATALCYERGLPDFNIAPIDYATGSIIGVVTLKACVKQSRSLWFVGTYGFELTDPRPLPQPIPIRGQLGFWEVPEDVYEQMKAQLCR